jgi:ribulose bisphosphate carboxylase small subunit
LANEIARTIIARLPGIKAGPEYDEAIRTGTAYWETVLAGRPNTAEKQAADEALSRLLRCDAQVSGRRIGLIEKVSRAIR